jgi:2'-5' RNA ligase
MTAGRCRVGVALVLDAPVADEVDGLRRALGDSSLGRIAPHCTLVPPINIREDRLPAALARLRAAAAAAAGPIKVTLGPVATFLPDNPVCYLDIGGDLPAMRHLRDAVFGPPLERELSWPWVPHVTLADDADPDRITAAVTDLGCYAAVADFGRVVLLQHQSGIGWVGVADANLGRSAVVGRGGLALEITQGRILDPEARRALLGPEPDGHAPGEAANGDRLAIRPPFFPVVLTGRREGEVVGAAAAWRDGPTGHVAVLVAEPVRGQGLAGHLLAHLESALVRAGWDDPVLVAHGPDAFYRARSDRPYSNSTDE